MPKVFTKPKETYYASLNRYYDVWVYKTQYYQKILF